MQLPGITLSVGGVAGLLNIGLLFLQLTIPVLQGIVFLSHVKLENSAATWSVLSKMAYSSYLPQLLKTDATAGRQDGVSLGATLMIHATLLTTTLLGVAQVLSPIGLGEAVVSGSLVNATFAYAVDPSVFREATFSRDRYNLSRLCAQGFRDCPGTSSAGAFEDVHRQQLRLSTVAENITECFQSGTSSQGDLRSSPFDIQFRQYATQTQTVGNISYQNVTGFYSYIGQVVLESGYYLKEGVVVDAMNGGLGFRNHTVPVDPQMPEGATWSEDLLWIDPVTSCIGTNWTLYSRAELTPFADSLHQSIQDGAWLSYEDHSAVYRYPLPNPQGSFRFDQRLAEASEVLTQKLFKLFNIERPGTLVNITMDMLTQQNLEDMLNFLFPFQTNTGFTFYEPDDDAYLSPEQGYPGDPSRRSIDFSTFPTTMRRRDLVTSSATSMHSTPDCPSKCDGQYDSCSLICEYGVSSCYKNICGLFDGDLSGPSTAPVEVLKYALRPCRNYSAITTASIATPYVSCYFSLPALSKVDNTGESRILEPQGRPISICASGLAASVKRVEFVYNRTKTSTSNSSPSLSDLQVLNIDTVHYEKDEDEPLWAVEDPGPSWTVANISLQWGLVSDAATIKFAKGIRLVRSESLPLPASLTGELVNGNGWGDSMAGSRAPSLALRSLVKTPVEDTSALGPQDYATYFRWQSLCGNGTTMHKVTNLRWTDMAANMMTGAKSRLTPDGDASAVGEVLMYRKTVTYNYKYGIVAFLCCALWLVWALVCLYAVVFARHIRRRMSRPSLAAMINTLSAGRLLAWSSKDGNMTTTGNGRTTFSAPTKEWLKEEGKRIIKFEDWVESHRLDAVSEDEKDNKIAQSRDK